MSGGSNSGLSRGESACGNRSVSAHTSAHLCAWKMKDCFVRLFGWLYERFSAGGPLGIPGIWCKYGQRLFFTASCDG